MEMLVGDAGARELTVALTDQVTRIAEPRRAARRFAGLVGATATAPFLARRPSPAPCRRARRAPPARVVMPLVSWRLRRETSAVILPAEDPAFARHARRRRRARASAMNVNVLGEAILGDDEAGRRLDAVVRARSAGPTSTTSR